MNRFDSKECGGDDVVCRRLDSGTEEEMAAVPRSFLKRRATEVEAQVQIQEDEGEDDGVICRRLDSMEDLLLDSGRVQSASVIRGSKHADGSIYRQDTHFYHRLYRLDDTRETLLKPTNPSPQTGTGCAMMQIFSLNLAIHSAHSTDTALAGPIRLYGFMAVRDLLHPLRNYVFNRSRDDPLVLDPSADDPFLPLPIQMHGPKRGIYLQARTAEDEDLQLIDGAATFSELIPFHGTYTNRILGNHGTAVDITLALLQDAVEARIRIGISKIPAAGINFSVSCSVSGIHQEIKLFDGVIDKPGNLRTFVVAVVHKSPLILHFKLARADGIGKAISRFHGYPYKGHGHNWEFIPLDLGTIETFE
ncbi:hypothetical protein U9M48_028756 [Paspalum notatum var. saurae]|uniref:DUF6598 domain-containing protein n=1 Tax=Paspalum notatum var. saurae TaxID=547442 RepID=A0AAQ3X224_PASNO